MDPKGRPKGAKGTQNGAKACQKGTKGSQIGAQRKPKSIPKSTKGEKGAKQMPKRCQNIGISSPILVLKSVNKSVKKISETRGCKTHDFDTKILKT